MANRWTTAAQFFRLEDVAIGPAHPHPVRRSGRGSFLPDRASLDDIRAAFRRVLSRVGRLAEAGRPSSTPRHKTTLTPQMFGRTWEQAKQHAAAPDAPGRSSCVSRIGPT